MSKKSSHKYPILKDKSGKELEDLTLKLLRQKLKIIIDSYRSQGYAQYGIDLIGNLPTNRWSKRLDQFGIFKKTHSGGSLAVSCKCDEKLNIRMVKNDYRKAITKSPIPISAYILATCKKKGVKLETDIHKARSKDLPFLVRALFWQDIEVLLDEFPKIAIQYFDKDWIKAKIKKKNLTYLYYPDNQEIFLDGRCREARDLAFARDVDGVKKVVIAFFKNTETINLESLVGLDIEEINIRDNSFEYLNLSPLQKCRELRYAYFSNNALHTIDLTPLGKCKDLDDLHLYGNKLTRIDLKPLSKNKKLGRIDLASNKISEVDITPLFACKNFDQFGLLGSSEFRVKASRKKKLQIPKGLEYLSSKIDWF